MWHNVYASRFFFYFLSILYGYLVIIFCYLNTATTISGVCFWHLNADMHICRKKRRVTQTHTHTLTHTDTFNLCSVKFLNVSLGKKMSLGKLLKLLQMSITFGEHVPVFFHFQFLVFFLLWKKQEKNASNWIEMSMLRFWHFNLEKVWSVNRNYT